MKWFSFFFFGFSSLLLTILVLPPMRLVLHPKERFKKHARHFVSLSFRFFIGMMNVIGAVVLKPDNKKAYRCLESKIVVANHPSLLDSVMLISLIPNADSIVAGYLTKSILRGIVRQLYIVNSPNYNDQKEIMDAAIESLKLGNCLLIFPEGTRTHRSKKVTIKKGAARLSLESGCSIVPVNIGGTDKYGLGKKDPWTGFNPTERYIYKINMNEEIHPQLYNGLSKPAAVRALTKDIMAALFPKEK
jgi:1-acyl-sn-glycerol-3-phosphate acyltransferase